MIAVGDSRRVDLNVLGRLVKLDKREARTLGDFSLSFQDVNGGNNFILAESVSGWFAGPACADVM